MAFDSLVLKALEPELTQLVGSRVLKIHQPSRLEIILTLRHGGENLRLLLSAHPQQARLHLTAVPRTNPAEPPPFCMYLRRHLEGTRLRRIRRPEGERIAGLTFEGRDELGEPRELELIAEIMGKHSNIILVDTATGTILEAIKHVTAEVSRYREVLPGLKYREPPAQNKVTLAELTELSFYSTLQAQGRHVVPALVASIAGFSPLLAREVVARSDLPEELSVKTASRAELTRLWQALEEVRALVQDGRWDPCVFRGPDGRAKEVAAFPLRLFAGHTAEHFSHVSAALDAFFNEKEEEERLGTARQNLLTLVRHAEERVQKKLGLHLSALKEGGEADHYRRYGELLFAHVYNLPQSAAEVEIEDWEHPGKIVRIPLDPRFTVTQNAQRYFQRFTKAKKTLTAAQEQVGRDRQELAYLESVALAIEEAQDLDELAEVRAELEKEGYAKRQEQGRNQGAKKAPRSEPLAFRSSAGFTILVGRNNRQNDRLTLRLAEPHDLWLHTQNIPGSHVVVRCPDGRQPPDETIYEAALLAAFHSKARLSSQVPVDYTYCRHVKKPAGARPGFVIYDHQRTLYVTPSPEKVEALRSQGS